MSSVCSNQLFYTDRTTPVYPHKLIGYNINPSKINSFILEISIVNVDLKTISS